MKWLHEMMEKKKWQTNTALNRLGAVRAFFNFHDLPLRFKRNELPKATLKPYKFNLTIEHIRKVFQYSSIWQKSLIILATETGLRISDLLSLRKSDIENLLQQQAPASMEVSTRKEGVIAQIHLSEEAMNILKLYLPTIPDKEFLFDKDQDTCNKALQNLFKQA